ncbi:choice-of-anchor Q domain-containing protein [Pedobacter chitinilyticus]|uniref:T9SS type A sorting domain-containing protein n=1 Tax=Pedobacter chitinilyticus TaxID=2233776 RepID=A0A443YP88_9SPHI|nr:choice-of-anchor Q domain-containing protein [Pedobacter chitinilyticus]RWU05611.1 T9SS type A sorting domain-containing protein [Pedobacter chitinilyticus]
MKNQSNMMKIKITTLFIFLASFSFAQTPDANGIVYVKKGATGSGDSWDNAVGELADVLKVAKANTAIKQVWVAGGTYKPMYSPFDHNFGADDGRNNSFLLVKDLKIYGGFAGIETNLAQRDLSVASNQSFLSGDANGNDAVTGRGETLTFANNADNYYHVVISAGDMGTAELNGFNVKGGNANSAIFIRRQINSIGVSNHSNFGGLYINNSSPTITLCHFSQNYATGYGGGIGTFGTRAPIITLCTISGNSASQGGGIYLGGPLDINNCLISENRATNGGGVYIDSSLPKLASCNISNNYATTGGGLHNTSSPTVMSCRFSNNKAEHGGGVYIDVNFSKPKFVNCLMANNGGGSGGALEHSYEALNTYTLLLNCTLYGNSRATGTSLHIPCGEIRIENCILWDNGRRSRYEYAEVKVKKSLVDGDIINTSWGSYTDLIPRDNVTTEKLFIDAPNGNFKLRLGSPAIGSGDNSLYENGDDETGNSSLATDRDAAGNARLWRQNIDLGAYENTNTEILYVKNDATGERNGDSWQNAMPDLADALLLAKTLDIEAYGAIKEIWVSKGTHKPKYSAESGANFGTNQGRDNAFLMVRGVKLYGGFAGTETSLAQRDLSVSTNTTTLSGDFNNDDIITGKGQSLSITNNSENAYHVVISADNSTGAVLDGFTITGGNANTSATFTVSGQTIYRTAGGGMAVHGASPSLSNLKFYGNSASIAGGGMYNYDASPSLNKISFIKNKGGALGMAFSPTLQLNEVSFNENHALYGGGMVIDASSSPILTNVSFTGNYASMGGAVHNSGPTIYNRVSFTENTALSNGGAIYNPLASPKFINASFIGNSAPVGGAVHSYGATAKPEFTNCTFSANQATNGQAIHATTSSQITLNNCIVWKNTGFIGNNNLEENSATYILKNTLLQYSGNGFNISLDAASSSLRNVNPLFANINGTDNIAGTADDNLNLKSGSPAINAGNNTLYEDSDGNGSNNSLTTDKDLAGNQRLLGASIDLGAFESISTLPVTLLSFQIKKENNSAVLTWETASEKDNAGFEIFRATDDKNFASIATIAGKGTTNQKSSYIWYDRHPLNDLNYYKLVQKDIDGKTEELGIGTLNFKLNSEGVLLYPNPVIEKAKVFFDEGKYKNIMLLDISGRVLQRQKINPTETEKVIAMDSIPKGTYLLKLQGDTQKSIVKIIKN